MNPPIVPLSIIRNIPVFLLSPFRHVYFQGFEHLSSFRVIAFATLSVHLVYPNRLHKFVKSILLIAWSYVCWIHPDSSKQLSIAILLILMSSCAGNRHESCSLSSFQGVRDSVEPAVENALYALYSLQHSSKMTLRRSTISTGGSVWEESKWQKKSLFWKQVKTNRLCIVQLFTKVILLAVSFLRYSSTDNLSDLASHSPN